MPSRSSAARRRFHTNRVIAKRINVAREMAHRELAEIVRGQFADRQYCLGCSRPRCRLCHPEKNFPNAERQRADEAWRRAEGLEPYRPRRPSRLDRGMVAVPGVPRRWQRVNTVTAIAPKRA